MRVLVIGSNSFSGSNFVNQCLQRGDDVYGVSRSREPDTIYRINGKAIKWDYRFSQSILITAKGADGNHR